MIQPQLTLIDVPVKIRAVRLGVNRASARFGTRSKDQPLGGWDLLGDFGSFSTTDIREITLKNDIKGIVGCE